jgi:hypothetical protein
MKEFETKLKGYLQQLETEIQSGKSNPQLKNIQNIVRIISTKEKKTDSLIGDLLSSLIYLNRYLDVEFIFSLRENLIDNSNVNDVFTRLLKSLGKADKENIKLEEAVLGGFINTLNDLKDDLKKDDIKSLYLQLLKYFASESLKAEAENLISIYFSKQKDKSDLLATLIFARWFSDSETRDEQIRIVLRKSAKYLTDKEYVENLVKEIIHAESVYILEEYIEKKGKTLTTSLLNNFIHVTFTEIIKFYHSDDSNELSQKDLEAFYNLIELYGNDQSNEGLKLQSLKLYLNNSEISRVVFKKSFLVSNLLSETKKVKYSLSVHQLVTQFIEEKNFEKAEFLIKLVRKTHLSTMWFYYLYKLIDAGYFNEAEERLDFITDPSHRIFLASELAVKRLLKNTKITGYSAYTGLFDVIEEKTKKIKSDTGQILNVTRANIVLGKHLLTKKINVDSFIADINGIKDHTIRFHSSVLFAGKIINRFIQSNQDEWNKLMDFIIENYVPKSSIEIVLFRNNAGRYQKLDLLNILLLGVVNSYIDESIYKQLVRSKEIESLDIILQLQAHINNSSATTRKLLTELTLIVGKLYEENGKADSALKLYSNEVKLLS